MREQPRPGTPACSRLTGWHRCVLVAEQVGMPGICCSQPPLRTSSLHLTLAKGAPARVCNEQPCRRRTQISMSPRLYLQTSSVQAGAYAPVPALGRCSSPHCMHAGMLLLKAPVWMSEASCRGLGAFTSSQPGPVLHDITATPEHAVLSPQHSTAQRSLISPTFTTFNSSPALSLPCTSGLQLR